MATKLDLFIKLSDGNPAYIAYQPLDANGNGAGNKGVYSKALAEPSGNGYQWRYSIVDMPVKVRLFIRPDSNTAGEIQLVVDRPASDKSRYQIFPPAGSGTAPSWVSARYTYNSSTSYLTIEAAGDPMQVMFERVDNVALSGGNIDGLNDLQGGKFYYNGELKNQNPFDKQWQFGKKSDGAGGIPAVPIRVTFYRTSDGARYATEFTPENATRKALFNAGTTTDTGTTESYDVIGILGNSITKYGNGYGYNASSPDKDYVHILTARHQVLNSAVKVYTQDMLPPGNIADCGYWEANHGNTDGGLVRFAGFAALKMKAFYVSLGENVTSAVNFGAHLIDLVNYCTANSPGCKIIVRTSIWGKTDIDNIIEATASQQGWIFVNGRNMPGATAGAENHPNDTGMQNLANLFWDKTPYTTTVTPPITPPVSDTNLAGLPPFEPFAYQPISDNANNWTGFDERSNMDGVIGEWVGLSNGLVNVRVYKRFGAAPSHISGPDGANRINIHDLGTMNGMTLYRSGPMSPNPNAIISEQWHEIGNDPIQHGDVFGHPSPVLYMARNSNMIYTVTQMNNWAVSNEQTDVTLEQWVVLQGRGVHIYTLPTFNRTYDKSFQEFRAQEFPTFFSDAKYRTLGFVNASGNVQFIANQPGQFDIPVTKPWVALAESGNVNAQAIGLGAPGLYMSSQWQKSLNEGTGELSNAAGYSQWRAFMHFDWNQKVYSHHYWVVGTVNEIQQYCEAQADPRNRMTWKFNQRWGRGHNCWKNGVDEGYPGYDDGREITKVGSGEFYIKLPYMAIQASSVSKFYIRYKSSGFNSPWRFVYVKSGQGESENFLTEFSTQNDNQWHTLEIPLNWSGQGIIQQIKMSNDGASNGSKIKIDWYNTTNADPGA